MARYADPHHCPDCGTDLDWTHRQGACPVCRLPLAGRAPADLYATLAHADTILAFMQAERLPITVDAGAPLATPQTTGPATGPALPGASTQPRPAPWQPLPRSAPAPRRARLGVPALLLGLGALCILVAAVVFLAIAWSVLGVAGRTSVLVGLTVAAGALTALFTRKDLRAAAETLAVLALALFSFDLTGARASGWFGPVETLRFVTLAAGVVVVAGAVATLALRRLGPALTGLQVVGGLAYVASALAGVLDVGERRAAVGLAVVLLVSLAVVAAARRLGLVPLSWGPLLVAVGSAVGLVLTGVERTLSDNVRHTTSWSAMWPLLLVAALAAGLVAALAAVGSRDATLRALVNAAATLLVVFAVVVPHLHGIEAVTVAASVLLVLCGIAALARVDAVTRTAQLVGLVAVGVAGVGTATYLGGLLATSLGAAEDTDLWELGATAGLPAAPDLISGWAVVFAVVAAAATHVLVTLADPARGPRDRVAGVALAWLPAVSAAAAVAVCGHQPTLAVACLALLAGSVAPAVGARRGTGAYGTACAACAAVLLATAAVVSLAAASVTVGVWVVGLAAGLLLVRETRDDVAALAAAWVPCAAAVTTGAIGHLSGASVRVNALVVLVVLAGVVLALPWLPGAGREGVRRSVQGAALLAAGAATLAGVSHTQADAQLLWLAVYLTISGATAAAVGIRDRDGLAVLVGTVLMLGATWVRLVDTGVETVEAYTGPVALVLAAVGLHALLTRPDVRTPGALGPALGVALLPSLLLVAADPLSLRALVLGLSCLVLVGLGVSLRWSAALLYGAAVGAVVVVIEVAPLGQGVPRWVLIGSAGAALLVAGTTWEHLVVNGRRVWSQVSALR